MSNKRREDDSENLRGGDLGLGHGLKPGGIPLYMDLGGTLWEGLTDSYQMPTNSKSPLTLSHNNLDYSTHLLNCKACAGVTDGISCPEQFLQKLSKPVKKLALLRRANTDPEIDPSLISSSSAEEALTMEEKNSKFAEVSLGTSIRQQKILYEHNRNEVLREIHPGKVIPTHTTLAKNGDAQESGNRKSESELLRKLRMAEREIEILHHDLENCQKISEARCKAIRLFKGQSYALQSQQIDSAKKANQLNKTLQEELNRIQFELEYQQAAMMTSQDMWAARFARVTEENTTLMTSKEELTEKVKKLQAGKTALMRERDELLALIDVQERQRYESTRSQSSDDMEYSSFTSTELAVLGACRCRINSPQPCGCAHAAAVSKREIARLRSELDSEKRRTEESVILADSYRIAFEEQLNRNSSLIRRLVEMTSSMSLSNTKTVGKTRAALRWFIKQLNEEDYLPPRIPPQYIYQEEQINYKEEFLSEDKRGESPSSEQARSDTQQSVEKAEPNCECSKDTDGSGKKEDQVLTEVHTETPQSHPSSSSYSKDKEIHEPSAETLDSLNKNDDDIINMLVEMIGERTEALAHQRLATRMLAKKLTEAESKLAELTEDVFDK